MNSITLPGNFFSMYVLIGSVLLPLLFIASCENSIDPLDEERGIYSIYGAINMNSDVNYIRVRDLNVPIRDGEIVDFNAEVTLQNLYSSDLEILKDTLVEFDGIYVWNFESTMPIEPETKFEVAVENPEGVRVSATATTPNFASAAVLSDMPDCTTSVEIDIGPILSGNIQAEIGFRWLGRIHWVSYTPQNVPIDFPKQTEMDERTLEIRVTPLSVMTQALDEPRWCHELESELFYYRYTHYGPDFFDETISDTLDIPGGSGNLGAFYDQQGTFRIDTAKVCQPFCPD